MVLTLISVALFLGIILIFIEVFVIPGTTVFGIFGSLISITAIYFAYSLLGATYGHLSIIIGFIVFMIFFIFGKKFMDRNHISLSQEITGRVNVFEAKVVIGDIGVAHTDIKPNGKAIFGDEKLEVYSTGQYIDRASKLEVIKIIQNKIFVKPLN